ncbi:Vesicle trafficking between the ER and Golgi [Scheffersomyces spartinae]|uniref:Vesicle trafficking between the ER and Golgi n=1 Tax=Scheffersomyces spartinae TaxID=45513 RepID=A0A9P7VAF0_9ASCO|nr:Vesicle trafficking between the ER and Golgi [Scheffersomyces spartinae]KAG7194140.1 Vesicle trafficking between the ER and Golgi [Scheffersomyces spartinae]
MSLAEGETLRDKQIGLLERMLHLNRDGTPDLTLAMDKEEIIWKVLIMDLKAQEIISSILRMNDLMKCGITWHSLINIRRVNMPDTPAIYFVEPTIENIVIIIEDINLDKYDEFYINFTTSIDRNLLEEFAKKASMLGKANKIKQIYDQYLNFVVTESNLFSLGMSKYFYKFNNPRVSEDEIEQYVEKISNGLLSAVITSDSIPIIRCPQGGAAELIATLLDSKLRDYLNNSRGLSNGGAPAGGGGALNVNKRPVLVLLDRNIDLTSMFAHSWIYQCMVSDVFTLKRNRITIRKYSEKSSNNPTQQEYDLDPRDFFWNKYSGLPFPDTVENADIELNLYKKEAQELTNKTGISSMNDINNLKSDDSADTYHIQQAVDLLPELTIRKRTLDMHMDILASLIGELQAKNLDKFFEVEQNVGSTKVQQEFLNLFNEASERNNGSDKLRTFLILILTVDTLSDDFIQTIRKKFSETYPELDLSSFDYIVKFKQLSKLNNYANFNDYSQKSNSGSDVSNNASALLGGLSSKLYGLTEGRITEGLTSIASKIKNFIPEKKQLPITNIVESIMDPLNNASKSWIQVTDEYLFFDPKLRGGHSKQPKRQAYDDSLVFVVGGGNYIEYQNLQEWAASSTQAGSKDSKRVIYGSTDIISPTLFLEECAELGRA